MIDQEDALSADPLAQRLEHLDLTIPPVPPLAVLPTLPRRRLLRRWRSGLMATAAVALIALTVTAFVYPGGLVGLTQDALQAAGLSGSQVVPLTGSGANANLKVSVSGVYADQVSTVLFVEVDETCQPGPGCGIGGPYLTDQFGTRYDITGGEGIGVGAYPMFFQPLSGPAASGARLTLHVPQGSNELRIPLSGTWTAKKAHDLTPPTSIVDNNKKVTYQITSLLYSGTYLEVHSHLSGELQNVIVYYGPRGQESSGKSWPGVFLVDPSGKWQIPLATGGNPPNVNDQVQDETRIFSIAKPGIYRIVVATTNDRNSTPASSWTVLAEWTVVVS
jgi:hypothetical protein